MTAQRRTRNTARCLAKCHQKLQKAKKGSTYTCTN